MNSHQEMARRILLSLAYADQFEFPLQLSELWSRLIGVKRVGVADISRVLPNLLRTQLIRVERLRGDMSILLGNRVGLLAQRRARKRFSQMKLLELQPLLKFSSYVPWIEAIAVTGSVAVENAQLQDDTDLLIVARSGSLWLVRPILIAFAWVVGKRRSWRAEEPNSWCFNLWLEPSSLAVPTPARSVYTAHEVLQAKWVFDRNAIGAQFVAANFWVGSIFPNWLPQKNVCKMSATSWLAAIVELLLVCSMPAWFFGNCILYALQRVYMQPHKTSERVQLKSAYFHPRDTKSVTSKAWKESIRSLIFAKQDILLELQNPSILPKSLVEQLKDARQQYKRIVLATGVFDVFHEEHVVFLEKAAGSGECLLVGVESDKRVRYIKGEGRPVFPAKVRAKQVGAVPAVSMVMVLPDEFNLPTHHAALLQAIRPNILAVSDSSAHLDRKLAAIEAVGGKLVVVHQHNAEISSTQILAEQASSD